MNASISLASKDANEIFLFETWRFAALSARHPGRPMRLTLYTDYAMRVLLHLAAHDDDLTSINEIARAYGISRNHLMKVVQDLSRAGVVKTVRGRNGGLRLGRPADQIRIGDVVRHTEDGFQLVDCSQCVIASACSLPRILNEAVRAFLDVLDRYTVDDLLQKRVEMRGIFSPATLAIPLEPAPGLSSARQTAAAGQTGAASKREGGGAAIVDAATNQASADSWPPGEAPPPRIR